MDRILARVSRQSPIDLEATEFYVRTAMLAVGSRVIERVLQRLGPHRPRTPMVCRCGQTLRSEGLRTKRLVTILGPVTFRRPRYSCWQCGRSYVPADVALDIEGTRYSPGARRMMVRAGSYAPFADAAEDLNLYAQLGVSAKNVERVAEQVGQEMNDWMERESTTAQLLDGCENAPQPADEPIDLLYVSFDGTGTPMRASELTDTQSKTAGERPKTREVKLGCVFTQTTRDEQGRPVRDPASTTYVGAIENSVDFGHRIFGEALRRGLRHARRVVVLFDGAAYNKSIAAEHFPDAIVIIDLYHARERLWALAKRLLSDAQRDAIQTTWLKRLDQGDIEGLLQAVRTHLPRSGKRRKKAIKDLRYFETNAPYMRYARFRRDGLFVGSGVVEAGCKTLIGRRLKQSGMFWSLRGANAIIAARCCHYSRRVGQFWEDRAA